MRYFILLSMLALLPCTYAHNNYPQGYKNTKYKPSVKKNGILLLGINFSSAISWLDVTHYDLHTDGATIAGGVGLTAEYAGKGIFSLVSGLNLISSGGYVFDNASLSDSNTKNNFLINYSAVEIPLLLRVSTEPFYKTSYYVQGGVSAAHRLSATETHQSASFKSADTRSKITGLIEPLQFNFRVGLGAKYRIFKKSYLFAEATYKRSIRSIASQTGYLESGQYSSDPVPVILNGNMVFSVGVLF